MNGFHTSGQTQTVSSFQELVSTPFYGEVNALCWERKLEGDFSEITEKILTTGNITELSEQSLIGLSLTEQGNLAREKVLEDLRILKKHGAAPVLNIIHPMTIHVFKFSRMKLYFITHHSFQCRSC